MVFSFRELSAVVVDFFLPTGQDPAKVSVPNTITKIFLRATVHPEVLDRIMFTVSSCSLDSSSGLDRLLLELPPEGLPEAIAASSYFTLSSKEWYNARRSGASCCGGG